ncbi:hypothetical protein [Aureimonas jatrophae]|uniref:Uncharacterized protein n=1 Tax=Aureimonas jatrophae TaxID=1166073 RepID=A0A1H0IU33_9HYPH|nr:hypothetical protein [Aureimonas jatrophae]MBB3952353.1 hypothetical protein [Aureimonas jatrophae]SDO34720.1 hypothetical protein SAMN05192530_105330 [Aureimonas jatrophae]
MGSYNAKALETIQKTHDAKLLDEFIAQAADNPMRVALECQTAVHEVDFLAEKSLSSLLAVGYAVAFRLKDSPEDLRKLATNNHWSPPIRKLPTGDKILRLVFRFLKQAWVRGAAYNTATRYTVALARSFDEGVAPSAIPRLIEDNGGIEAFYRKEVGIRKADKGKRRGAYRHSAPSHKSLSRKPSGRSRLQLGQKPTSDAELLALSANLRDQISDFVFRRREQKDAG